jgi:hypothetical protein
MELTLTHSIIKYKISNEKMIVLKNVTIAVKHSLIQDSLIQ